ncbi:hypothetical protein OIE63_19495 [Streptomyces sp. NBC_01795]|uniref:hypothetical protein n=1 Tax=Streptomyces sp. NBC_01795 TaxID=2975943 RepID=UPI002DD98E36|nr:hypothetical protein [Streptomyces sp. NBC_01795]WSA93519.1 hypothetical protein OIE63_19495 [Streptomyces sp. NBC_01795]
MRTTIEAALSDDAEWADAEHAYGDGPDTLKWLREACGDDPERAGRAIGVLGGCLVHQSSVYAGSAKAYPVLVKLLCDQATPRRGDLADLVLGITLGTGETERVHLDIRAAHAHAARRLLPLLADPVREVRHRVAYLTGLRTGHEEHTVPALRERAWIEPDSLLAAAMTAGAARHPHETRAAWLTACLSPDRSPGVRAAAAWGLARAELPWPPEATAAVEEAWAHGDVLSGDVIDGEEWRWSENPLAETLHAMDDHPRAAAVCLRLAREQDADTAERGVFGALAHLSEHPGAAPHFAPLVPLLREHPDTVIRGYAEDVEDLTGTTP